MLRLWFYYRLLAYVLSVVTELAHSSVWVLILWRYYASSSKFSINLDSLILLFLFIPVCSNCCWQASLMRFHCVHVGNLIQEVWVRNLVLLVELWVVRWGLLICDFKGLVWLVVWDMQRWIKCSYVSFVMTICLSIAMLVLRRSLINAVIHCWYKSFEWDASWLSGCNRYLTWSMSWYTLLLCTLIESRSDVFTKVLIDLLGRISLIRAIYSHFIGISFKIVIKYM